jgi:hypothetical protein
MARGHAPPPPPAPPLPSLSCQHHPSPSLSQDLEQRPVASAQAHPLQGRPDRPGRGLECKLDLVVVQPPVPVGPCNDTASSANREWLAAATTERAFLTVVWYRASSGGAPSSPFGSTPSPPSSSRAPLSLLWQRPSVPSLLGAPPPPPYGAAPTANVMHLEPQQC